MRTGYIVRAAGGRTCRPSSDCGVGPRRRRKACGMVRLMVTGGSTAKCAAPASTSMRGCRRTAAKLILLDRCSEAVDRERLPEGARRKRLSVIARGIQGAPPRSGGSSRARLHAAVPTSPALKSDRLPFAALPGVSTSRPKWTGSATTPSTSPTPGMLHAAIEMAPVYGGTLMSVDHRPADAMRA